VFETFGSSLSEKLGRPVRYGVALMLLLALRPATTTAQAPPSSPDPIRFVLWTGGDVKAFGRGVLSMRTLYATAGVGGVMVLLSRQDPELTKGAIELAEDVASRPRRILNEIGNVRAVRPMALVLFLGTLASGNERLQDAAFTSLEAIVFSNLITDGIKGLTGRARPLQEEGAFHYRPLSGNTSFPSGHATTVFAFTTPWLLYYRNVPATALFILGAGTAFTRMADKFHWFTDVLVGGAVGFTTGYLLTRRHQRESLGVTVAPVVANEQSGLFVRVRF
jgi:hypothetical protein